MTREQAWQEYREIMTELAGSARHIDVIQRADLSIRTIAQSGSNGVDVAPILEALCSSDPAELLEIALENLTEHESELMSVLRNFVLPMMYRGPVGAELRQSFS
ncbi:hypothetical protein [Nocardia gamkensis]|uniref:hypothetical protein n=1 Tax=Nocardia gamkensis TaxID=352869 RepID=UPI0037CAAD93